MGCVSIAREDGLTGHFEPRNIVGAYEEISRTPNDVLNELRKLNQDYNKKLDALEKELKDLCLKQGVAIEVLRYE